MFLYSQVLSTPRRSRQTKGQRHRLFVWMNILRALTLGPEKSCIYSFLFLFIFYFSFYFISFFWTSLGSTSLWSEFFKLGHAACRNLNSSNFDDATIRGLCSTEFEIDMFFGFNILCLSSNRLWANTFYLTYPSELFIL